MGNNVNGNIGALGDDHAASNDYVDNGVKVLGNHHVHEGAGDDVDDGDDNVDDLGDNADSGNDDDDGYRLGVKNDTHKVAAGGAGHVDGIGDDQHAGGDFNDNAVGDIADVVRNGHAARGYKGVHGDGVDDDVDCLGGGDNGVDNDADEDESDAPGNDHIYDG